MGSQLNLFTKKSHPNLSGTSLEHGGSTRVGKRKIARPFDKKRAMHLVMRASSATGHRSMLSKFNKRKVDSTVFKFASKFSVTILGYSNVGNHLHLIIKSKSKDGFKNFLRTITGLIARIIMRAEKSNPKGKFWNSTAFTRVLSWGREYIETQIYLTKNRFEGEDLVLDTPTGLRRFRFNLLEH